MSATVQPIAYTPDVEMIAPDEEKTFQGLRDALHDILETTSKDYGHAVRSVHAKGHGLLTGTLEVLGGLPPHYAQGLFAEPASYDAVLRLSTNPGDLLDDSISVPRGAALKVIGVPGAAEGSQDFVMVDGPAFAAPDAAHFLPNLKLLSKTTDRGESAKKILSAILRTTEAALETVGLESATLTTMGGAQNTHPLGRTFYSATPFRYGDAIAKFSLRPVSPTLKEVETQTVATAGRPDALREDVNETAIEADMVWELCVQLCTDLETMPVEDPTVAWDEAASPFVPVARLTMPAQRAWETGVSEGQEDRLLFTPWHCLEAHRPLGQINRARKDAYVMSSGFRANFNGCPIHQPRTAAEVKPAS